MTVKTAKRMSPSTRPPGWPARHADNVPTECAKRASTADSAVTPFPFQSQRSRSPTVVPLKPQNQPPFLGQRDQRRQRKSRKEKNQFPDEAQTQKGNTENKKPTRHGNRGKDSSRLGGQITESSRRRLARSLPFFCVLQYFFLQPIPVAATSCDATENDISF